MTDNTECCGWASWGELAGMGDGRVRVDAWDGEETVAVGAERGGVSSDETLRAGASTPAIVAGRHSGRRARAQLVISRWRLAERNKRG
ncbi:MAG TPA: hypothetical protein VIR34_07475 [Gemmatimonadaceae bacterium]|jgi:hypothetical protein